MNKCSILPTFVCVCCLFTICMSASSKAQVALNSRFYQPQSALGYQQLSVAPATAHMLCPVPRADSAPLQLSGHKGQSVEIQLSNEQGNLRWWNTAGTESAVLLSESFTSASALRQTPVLGMPLLLLPPLTATKATPQPLATMAPHQVIWHDPLSHQYQMADVTDLHNPQQRWRWSPPLAQQQPWLQTPVLHRLDANEPVLLINSATAVKPMLWLVQAEKGQLLAEVDLAAGYQSGHQPVAQLSALTAAPAALDRDGDGALDRIYQVDQQGQLIRLDVAADLSYQSSLVADLTAFQGAFDHAILAVRALSPVNNAGAKTLISSKAVDVIVLIAEKQQQYQLIVLFLPEQLATPLLYKDLVGKGGAQMFTMQNTQGNNAAISKPNTAYGWRYELPGVPVVLPEIVAGVVYLPLRHSGANATTAKCQQARQADQLLALHLYQASAVYADAVMKVQMQTPLQLMQQPGDTLALQDVAQNIVLDELRGIHNQCSECTEVLGVRQLSQWRQLALFRQEEVY